MKSVKWLRLDSAGRLAVVSLLLCTGSGVLLAIPYDFSHAYGSILELILLNSVGNLVRNLHYWSAQTFFIFTLIHLYDHLSSSGEHAIRNGRIWLLLCLALFFLGYEMLSGFVLKGDMAGVQARRILGSLLDSIPVAGNMLRTALAGSEDNWLIVYVQHIGLGTILLFVALYEHVKSIQPRLKTALVLFVLLLLTALFFRAPLGMEEGDDLRGPWFFLGIQEMLHWISHPGYLVGLFFIPFLWMIALPRLNGVVKRIIQWMLGAMAVGYLLLTLLVFSFRGENWQWKLGSFEDISLIFSPVFTGDPSTTLSGPIQSKQEGCMVCHGAMKGLSEAHNPVHMGCYACHKGNPFTLDKELAHKKMVMVPGDFSNVRQTCGTQSCHSGIVDRIMESPMATANGLVGVDKYAFGEAATPNDTFHITELKHTMADDHLRNLCAGCHLGKEKLATGNPDWLERGGGCNACHLHYGKEALTTMQGMQSGAGKGISEVHPAIDLQVSNDRCKSCHSRSGRISLSYEGWNETSLKASDITDTVHYRILPDDRVVEQISSDLHFQKGMACIDCHGSYELMGDGKYSLHKEDAVAIQCIDCHPSIKPNTALIGALPDQESLMIAGLRGINPETKILVSSKSNRPILNTEVDSAGRILLKGKLTGAIHLSKPMAKACSRGLSHSRLSCESCHTAWVPQCIGCHNTFEKSTEGIDFITNKPTIGTWVEYTGKIFAEAPVLGVNENGGKVVTAMPGMVMTSDKESYTKGAGSSFIRWYAPASGHTTLRVGRSCKSCHNSSLAIGYGRGELIYRGGGNGENWIFTPQMTANNRDHLPEDAWIGFLKESKMPSSTRQWLRPLNLSEQKRVLNAGSCLTCHEEKSLVMISAIENFKQTCARRSKRCFK